MKTQLAYQAFNILWLKITAESNARQTKSNKTLLAKVQLKVVHKNVDCSKCVASNGELNYLINSGMNEKKKTAAKDQKNCKFSFGGAIFLLIR